MSVKDLQKNIWRKGGLVISEGTLRVEDLLDAAYSVMVDYNLRTPLKQEIRGLFFNGELMEERLGDAEYIWNEDVFDYMNDIAPSGYYFGSHEGDGACIGFFQASPEL